MPRIIAIANRKGGVGKTTTTVNVATAMAATGKKVLVIDLDPQGNATTSMGINKKGRMASSYEVLLGEKTVSEAIVWTEIPNFSIVPSSADLAGAEVELVDIENREFALKKAIEKIQQGAQDVELTPQSQQIRKLQHELVEQHNLQSESVGEGTTRRLRIVGGKDYKNVG